jgi:hypothetical protein
MRIPGIRRLSIGILGALLALGALVVHAHAAQPSQPLSCQRAITREGSRFVRAQVRELGRCADQIVRGLVPDPGPGGRLSFCRARPKTALRLATAAARLQMKIERACGGADRICGTPDDNLDMQTHVGFPATCPNLENRVDPDCSKPIDDCRDVADCLECIHRAGADQATGLYYDAMADVIVPSPAARAVTACQRAIGRESGTLLGVEERALWRCWDDRLRGKHGYECPDAGAPRGNSAWRAAAKIARAEMRASMRICRQCGGTGRKCRTAMGPVPGDGRADDLLPSTIGFLAACPAVTVPMPRAAGTAPAFCGASIATLEDLVRCVECMTEFTVHCVELAQTPQFHGYPAACNPLPIVVDLLPPFLCHDASGPPRADVGGVALEDALGTRTVTLHDANRLCAPADVEDEPGTALAKSYRLTGYHLTQEAPTFAEVKDVTVTDRLGSITLDVVRPVMLLVPSIEAPAGSPPPAPSAIDHFQCYDVRGAQAHVDGIAVVDEFGAAVADVKRPATLCLAADKNGEGVLRPATHLMCYEVRAEPPRPDPAAPVDVVNQLGGFALDVGRTTELCLPATVSFSHP